MPLFEVTEEGLERDPQGSVVGRRHGRRDRPQGNSRYGMKGLPWETRWRHIDPTDETKGTETLLSLPKWICKVIRDL